MATYFINRKDAPNLTAQELVERKEAFEVLYCGQGKGDLSNPGIEIQIRGEWPTFERDGLYLKNNGGARVVRISKENLLIEFKNDMNQVEQAEVPLTEQYGDGFWQITFMTVAYADATPIFTPDFNILDEPDDINQARWRKSMFPDYNDPI